jgi:hypothetical protein
MKQENFGYVNFSFMKLRGMSFFATDQLNVLVLIRILWDSDLTHRTNLVHADFDFHGLL